MPSAPGIILLKNKGQKKHDDRPHGKNLKGIDVCQTCRLRLQGLVDAGVSLQVSPVTAQTSAGQMPIEGVGRLYEIGVVDPGVLHQSCLMELRTPGNHRGY